MIFKSNYCYLIALLVIVKLCPAQNDSTLLNESTKTQILLSYIQDEMIFYDDIKSIEDWQKRTLNEISKIIIQPSQKLEGHIASFNGRPFNNYNIQLFKIYIDPDAPRYLLAVRLLPQTGNPNGWFRIKGYTENDFIHMYREFLLKYVTRKEAHKILMEWQSQDPIFAEVDFDCLIKSVKTKNTNSECHVSVVYKLEKDLLYNGSPIPKHAYSEYSIFSKEPFRRIKL